MSNGSSPGKQTVGHFRDRELAVVAIDTCFDINEVDLRGSRDFESLSSRMDTLIRSRLQGVFTLKNGVPAVAVGSVIGGGEISRQCARIG
jgi:hypothetical protein